MAALNPAAEYRVTRDERVSIGPFNRQLVRGEVADFPENVMQSLLDGGLIEEVPDEWGGDGPNPNVSYRVTRSERVTIGPFDRRLVAGEIVDDFPDSVLATLIRGQQVEEVPKVEAQPQPEPAPEPQPEPEPAPEPEPTPTEEPPAPEEGEA